jgi:hypothetical protein
VVKTFEAQGLFYKVLERDAARWPSSSLQRTMSAPERRPLSHPPRPRSHRLSELPPPAPAPRRGQAPTRPLLEELEALRYQVKEDKRATEERKALYLRELNRLRLERDSLAARVERLEREAEKTEAVPLTRRKPRRALAATGGIATAGGMLGLVMLLRHRFGWFRHA